MITASVTRSHDHDELECFIIAVLAFRGTFFVNSFEKFDKQINFSLNNVLTSKTLNGEIKIKKSGSCGAVVHCCPRERVNVWHT